MTATRNPQRNGRPVRREAATHIFKVGQTVRLKDGFFIVPSKLPDTYRITATLPPRGNVLQYRIRSDDERHERVTTEDSLEPLNLSPGSGATLIETTFGHGPNDGRLTS
ncbi:hypothetical protein FHT72_000958 [Rhizobium sp. BK077]|jgi:hypothetical protein|uniref:Cold-shock protein n=1 Tax=Rhizobium anhuiense TaxID=1184720 RepID=A0A3S0SQL2_9HYPH|nr:MULTISPECIES: hypothetical protein [Rhizobium]MBB3298204.1 hypothetical protein [Rhizobium sp. BK112]MBB3366491.1 hypothetical protein [Rhizobium sp. BK077]MBB4177302.1 hypothetical protein [Rhizobium sp. BK109]MBB4252765.1 hypothetical protein [Rhizobium sp. BK008]RUM02205.1 hypothetical protein EEQ99_10595 [Rhizobium anhuiense]